MDSKLRLTLLEKEVAAFQHLMSVIHIVQNLAPKKLKPHFSYYQPFRYETNAHNLKVRNYKCIKCIDYAASKALAFTKLKKVFRRLKSIKKLKIENGVQQNIEFLYQYTSTKVVEFQLYKFSCIRDTQRDSLIKGLMKFKLLNSILINDIPPYPKNRKKEYRFLQNSITSMRKLKTLILNGTPNNREFYFICPRILSSLTKVENLNLTFSYMPAEELQTLQISLLKLQNLKNFRIELPEDVLSNSNLQLLKSWLNSSLHIERGLFSISSSTFAKDLRIFQDCSFLEFNFKLRNNLNELALNLETNPKITLPVSIDFNVLPEEIQNHVLVEKVLKGFSEFPNLKGIRQNFFFDMEICDLTNCYPIWANILTHYQFQKILVLHLSVPLSEENMENSLLLLTLTLPNLYNIEDISITFNRCGLTVKHIYLSSAILDLMQKIQKLSTLRNFEFNSEIEIMINFLNDFYIILTGFSQIKKLKSEWLCVSIKSFRTLCTRIMNMSNLQHLDVHLGTMMEISSDELRQGFMTLSKNIKEMKYLYRIKLTGDNECFKDFKPWKEGAHLLMKTCPTKIIDVSLGYLDN